MRETAATMPTPLKVLKQLKTLKKEKREMVVKKAKMKHKDLSRAMMTQC